jgi:hypothetical protein
LVVPDGVDAGGTDAEGRVVGELGVAAGLEAEQPAVTAKAPATAIPPTWHQSRRVRKI